MAEDPYWIKDDAPSQKNKFEEMFGLQKAIQKCINHLEDKFRMVLVLVDVEGLDYRNSLQNLRITTRNDKKPPGPRPRTCSGMLAKNSGSLPEVFGLKSQRIS